MPVSLNQARTLLDQGSWEEARDAFQSAIADGVGAEVYEGLAEACRWLEDVDAAIAALETAHRLYSDAGRDPEAAATAVTLAELILSEKGAPAVASGWLQRARHMLRDVPEDPTLVALAGLEAYLALAYDKDLVTARRLTEWAMERAHRLGMTDVEAKAQAQLGLVRVSQGELKEGMRLLDQATATALAGELSRYDTVDTYCFLITACERVRDFDRVAQWSQQVLTMATEMGSDAFAAFSRTQYAHVLIWRGEWAEAEQQLSRVLSDTEDRPLSGAMGLVLMSSLKRRQGEFEMADRLLRRAEGEPFRSAVRHMVLGARAALELESGNDQAAADLAERLLGSIPAANRIERVEGLETLVRARARLDQPDAAAEAAEELSRIADEISTEPLRGAAFAAEGIAARAAGDRESARDALERAIVLFDANTVPQEALRIRLDLARTLVELGKPDGAFREAEMARDVAVALGAKGDVDAAERILATLRPSGGPADLTDREVEVLNLLASGKGNREIADDLYLSVRTVERHISNIYAKIGAFGRSARVIATVYAKENDIT